MAASTTKSGLDHRRMGGGKPLLLIMGMSGTYDHWGQPFLEALAAQREVIVYDHRGVGASKPITGPFTIADLAADAVALLDELDLERVDVLGFSMGGMIAQELALGHSERVGSLVLAATFAGGTVSEPTPQETQELLAEAFSCGDRERALEIGWQVNVSERCRSDGELLDAFLAIGRRRAVPLATVQAQLEAIMGHDTSGRLGGLQAPTLVLHGTADRMLPVSNGEVLAELIPGARLEGLEGVGHLFSWEVPQRAASLVLEHLRSSEG